MKKKYKTQYKKTNNRRLKSYLLSAVLISALAVGSWFTSGDYLAGGSTGHYEEPLEQISLSAYAGSPYVEINNNYPFFTEDDLKSDTFESYSDLDELGRCGVAFANVSRELMPTEKRGEISSIKPTGWKQAKYEGIVDATPPFLYNRSHLIAYCLTAENDNEKNLITGTRYLNYDVMRPFEERVAKYLDKYDNHVLYRVTPVFEGDNLLASGVLMEAYSVEDKGKGICFCVYCYNVQPGIVIDYATGKNWVY